MPQYEIDISHRQNLLPVNDLFLRDAILHVLAEERLQSATISLALVDDAEIHRINREFLGHDYPTDVISFRHDQVSDDIELEMPCLTVCDQTGNRLDGELIVSVETAVREAAVRHESPLDEILLYLVHGLLHLCGYDDLNDEARPAMRQREREILARWNVIPTGLEV